MEDFREIRRAAGWVGLGMLVLEQTSRVAGLTHDISVPVIGAGALLFTLSVFGPVAAALVIRAWRGGTDGDQ